MQCELKDQTNFNPNFAYCVYISESLNFLKITILSFVSYSFIEKCVMCEHDILEIQFAKLCLFYIDFKRKVYKFTKLVVPSGLAAVSNLFIERSPFLAQIVQI